MQIGFGIMLLVVAAVFVLAAVLSLIFSGNYCFVVGFLLGPGLAYLGYRMVVNE